MIPTGRDLPGTPLPEFNGHNFPTIGVELELLLCRRSDGDLASTVVDPRTGATRHAFDAVAERVRRSSKKVRLDKEYLTNTAEVTTRIHRTVASASGELKSSIRAVRAACRDFGLFPLSAGLHPYSIARDQLVTENGRLREIASNVGRPARDMQATGLHVHVAVPNGDAAVRTADVLQRLAPFFVALSGSSPYWEGDDTAFASYRTLVFRGMPTTGLAPAASTWKGYRRWYDALRQVGQIQKPKDVHTDVRPSPGYGTVELRVCDAPPTLHEIASLVALCQCIVAQVAFPEFASADAAPTPGILSLRREFLEDNMRNAARHGLIGTFITDNAGHHITVEAGVRQLVATLQPVAAQLGCTDELNGVLNILESGPSASRQRGWVRSGATLEDVVENLEREFVTNRAIVPALPPTAGPRRPNPSPPGGIE